MPFTPFHMGAGLAIKAVAGRHFSLLTFGAAQVVMDLQPLVGMLRGDADLHGISHTYAGAAVLGALVAVAAPVACNPILRRYNQEAKAMRLPWLASEDRISRPAAAVGAFVGTFSHVLLDSLMHADMQPLWPAAAANALLFKVDVDAVYNGCLYAGVLGLAVWLVRKYRKAGQESVLPR